MVERNKYKGTYAYYLIRQLKKRGLGFITIAPETNCPIFVFRAGLSVKVRLKNIDDGDYWPPEHPEWKWFGEAGSALRAVDRVIAMRDHGQLPTPKARRGHGKAHRQAAADSTGDDPIPVEVAVDRAFKGAHVNYRKQRAVLHKGLACVSYFLAKCATLEARPDGSLKWTGHVPDIKRAVERAEVVFRRRKRARRKALFPRAADRSAAAGK
jgi:hypothetical protein